jgi:hypothetical protein
MVERIANAKRTFLSYCDCCNYNCPNLLGLQPVASRGNELHTEAIEHVTIGYTIPDIPVYSELCTRLEMRL